MASHGHHASLEGTTSSNFIHEPESIAPRKTTDRAGPTIRREPVTLRGGGGKRTAAPPSTLKALRSDSIAEPSAEPLPPNDAQGTIGARSAPAPSPPEGRSAETVAAAASESRPTSAADTAPTPACPPSKPPTGPSVSQRDAATHLPGPRMTTGSSPARQTTGSSPTTIQAPSPVAHQAVGSSPARQTTGSSPTTIQAPSPVAHQAVGSSPARRTTGSSPTTIQAPSPVAHQAVGSSPARRTTGSSPTTIQAPSPVAPQAVGSSPARRTAVSSPTIQPVGARQTTGSSPAFRNSSPVAYQPVGISPPRRTTGSSPTAPTPSPVTHQPVGISPPRRWQSGSSPTVPTPSPAAYQPVGSSPPQRTTGSSSPPRTVSPSPAATRRTSGSSHNDSSRAAGSSPTRRIAVPVPSAPDRVATLAAPKRSSAPAQPFAYLQRRTPTGELPQPPASTSAPADTTPNWRREHILAQEAIREAKANRRAADGSNMMRIMQTDFHSWDEMPIEVKDWRSLRRARELATGSSTAGEGTPRLDQTRDADPVPDPVSSPDSDPDLDPQQHRPAQRRTAKGAWGDREPVLVLHQLRRQGEDDGPDVNAEEVEALPVQHSPEPGPAESTETQGRSELQKQQKGSPAGRGRVRANERGSSVAPSSVVESSVVSEESSVPDVLAINRAMYEGYTVEALMKMARRGLLESNVLQEVLKSRDGALPKALTHKHKSTPPGNKRSSASEGETKCDRSKSGRLVSRQNQTSFRYKPVPTPSQSSQSLATSEFQGSTSSRSFVPIDSECSSVGSRRGHRSKSYKCRYRSDDCSKAHRKSRSWYKHGRRKHAYHRSSHHRRHHRSSRHHHSTRANRRHKKKYEEDHDTDLDADADADGDPDRDRDCDVSREHDRDQDRKRDRNRAREKDKGRERARERDRHRDRDRDPDIDRGRLQDQDREWDRDDDDQGSSSSSRRISDTWFEQRLEELGRIKQKLEAPPGVSHQPLVPDQRSAAPVQSQRAASETSVIMPATMLKDSLQAALPELQALVELVDMIRNPHWGGGRQSPSPTASMAAHTADPQAGPASNCPSVADYSTRASSFTAYDWQNHMRPAAGYQHPPAGYPPHPATPSGGRSPKASHRSTDPTPTTPGLGPAAPMSAPPSPAPSYLRPVHPSQFHPPDLIQAPYLPLAAVPYPHAAYLMDRPAYLPGPGQLVPPPQAMQLPQTVPPPDHVVPPLPPLPVLGEASPPPDTAMPSSSKDAGLERTELTPRPRPPDTVPVRSTQREKDEDSDSDSGPSSQPHPRPAPVVIEIPMGRGRKPPKPTPKRPPVEVPECGPPGPDGRVPCPICGRRFDAARVERHAAICASVPAKPVRALATHPEAGPEPAETPPDPEPEAPPPWGSPGAPGPARAAGADDDAAGLQVEADGRVTCPVCARHFSPSAAERHVPICKRIAAKNTVQVYDRPRGTSRAVGRAPGADGGSSMAQQAAAEHSKPPPQPQSVVLPEGWF